MKFFRMTAALACAAALFAAAGCGKKQDDGKIKVAISIPSADHGWTGGVVWWAEQVKREMEAKDPDVKVLISTARDSAEQVSKIENMLVQDVDALVLLPQEPAPLTGICEQAVKKGVYLVVDRCSFCVKENSLCLIITGQNGRRNACASYA